MSKRNRLLQIIIISLIKGHVETEILYRSVSSRAVNNIAVSFNFAGYISSDEVLALSVLTCRG